MESLRTDDDSCRLELPQAPKTRQKCEHHLTIGSSELRPHGVEDRV